MGRKKKDAAIGTSVIRDRFGHRKNAGKGDSFLHTSEIQDGADWGRLNLQSVTEQSNLEEFLSTAELAGTEFTAERMNISIVDADRQSGLPSSEQLKLSEKAQRENKELLKIPRRPYWDESTTADELEVNERTEFLEWRRKLAQLQENEHLILTPFERNLDFWRQLWRVIERSDIVVQIVDARNPLLFRCGDLEKYVKEVGEDKVNVILVNKADLLTENQRKYWAEYFDSINLKAAFWSAVKETERIAEEQKKLEEEEEYESEEEESESDKDEEEGEEKMEEETPTEEQVPEAASQEPVPSGQPVLENAKDKGSEKKEKESSSLTPPTDQDISPAAQSVEAVVDQLESVTTCDMESEDSPTCGVVSGTGDTPGAGCSSQSSSVKNSYELLTGDELIQTLRNLHTGPKQTEGITTIGLVGYPNVGKSSSINAILQAKKVPVSATPGRTKHFQTLYVEKTTLLCDCPGLVMPTFVTTKAEMVISGILPIDQMRDHIPPTALVCQRIPRATLEATYGIILPPPGEGEDPERPPTAMEILAAYGYMRGFMTHKGIPDYARAARNILKDYMNGKLLYAHPPPNVSTEDFVPAAPPQKTVKVQKADHTAQARKATSMYTNSVDKQFFEKTDIKMGKKGKQHQLPTQPQGGAYGVMVGGKKHFKKGKKEKLRRLHGNMDA